MQPRRGVATLLLVIPAACAGLMLAFAAAKGPYWLGLNSDPDYCYLLNSLNVAQGLRVHHTDHPGTLVHLLGALALRAFHLVAGRGDLADDVVQRSETYLRMVQGLFALICGSALWLLGRALRQATGHVGWGLLAQASFLLSATILPHLGCVKPEPVLFALASAMLALTARAADRPRLLDAVLLGSLCGAVLATKTTGLALLVLPVFVLRGWRSFAVLALSCVVVTALLTIPAWHDLRNSFSFTWRIATHSGHYGNGGASVLAPAAFARALGSQLWGEPVLALGLAAGAALLAVEWRTTLRTPARRVLLAVLVAQVLSLLMVSKHPADQYLAPGDNYFIPALSLSGGALALLAAALASRDGRWRWAVGAALVAVVAFGAVSLARQHQRLVRQREEQLAAVEHTRQHYPGHAVVYYYRSSSPAFALYFGDSWSGRRHTERRRELFPLARYFVTWGKSFAEGDLAPDVKAVMQGQPRSEGKLEFGRTARKVFGNDREAVCELR